MQNDTANFERQRNNLAARYARPSSAGHAYVPPRATASAQRTSGFDAVANLGGTLQSILNRSSQATTAELTQTRRESPEEARTRLIQEGKAGDVEAAVLAAKALYAGFGGPRNDADAFKLFKLAAEKGHAQAQYHTGYLLMYGYGTPIDAGEAVQWYKKAAGAGDARGELGYAMALLTGRGIEKNEGQALPIMAHLASRDLPANADSELREAQSLMAGLLGDLYRSGTGVAPSGSEAVRWYSIAAQHGDRFAARDLAKMYHEGDGVAKDYKQVMAWLAKAAELGHPEAQANMALLLVQGKEFPKNVPAAKHLAEQSAQQGHAQGWSLLGDFYSDGTLPKDFPKALSAYQKGAALGDSRSRSQMSPELLRVALLKPEEAAQDRSAAEQGELEAMLRWADRLIDGIGVDSNFPQALTWYEKAAEKGHKTAQGAAGLLLVTGQASRKDLNKGLKLIKQAADAQDPSAMLTMGDLYNAGAFGPNNANTLARQWYEKARLAKHNAADSRLNK